MKILLLTHDLERAKQWVLSQDVPNIFILDEREVAKENPVKYKMDFYEPDYSKNMCDFMSVKVMCYKYSRPLVVLMDMRHQTATAQIEHDHSILLYDGSLSRRIAYNPTYPVDFKANFNSKFPVDIL
jgi:hypothetical protein